MNIKTEFNEIFAGEHLSRSIIIESVPLNSSVRLSLRSTDGADYVTEPLSVANCEAVYFIPGGIIPCPGFLAAQAVAENGDGVIEKSRVLNILILPSGEGEGDAPSTDMPLNLQTLADRLDSHNHDSRYYCKAALDTMLDSKENKTPQTLVAACLTAAAETLRDEFSGGADKLLFMLTSDARYSSGGAKPESAACKLGQFARLLPLDFCGDLGDMRNGGGSVETACRELCEISALFKGETSSVPCVRVAGERDAETNGDAIRAQVNFMTQGQINADGVCRRNPERGAFYKDFVKNGGSRYRVIALNTADKESLDESGEGISAEQLRFFAQTLYDGGSLDNTGFVILSHHPLESYQSVVSVINAYIDGDEVTVGGVTYDFSESSASPILAFVHGHTGVFAEGYFGSTDIREYSLPVAAAGAGLVSCDLDGETAAIKII